MASSLPMELSYALGGMSDYSKNMFQLQTANATTQRPNSVIEILLPINSFIDLRSFALSLKASVNAQFTYPDPAGGAAKVCHSFLPPIYHLIDRMEVSAGGVILNQSAPEYSTIQHIKNVTADSISNEMSYKSVLMNEGLAGIQLAGGLITGSADETPQEFIINEWLGVMGSLEPSIIDTSTLSSIKLRLFLKSAVSALSYGEVGQAPGVFTDPVGAATSFAVNANYTLESIFGVITTMSFSSGMIESAIEQQLMAGSLQLPFLNYATYFQTDASQNKNVRFQLSVSCLNNLYAVARKPDFRTNNTEGVGVYLDRFGKQFFPPQLKFGANKNLNYRWSINNVFIPSYEASSLMAYKYLVDGNKYCAGMQHDQYSPLGCNSIHSKEDYFENQFIIPLQLNLPSRVGVKYMTGYNSSGLNSACFVATQASADGAGTPLDGGASPVGSSNETTIIAEYVSLLVVSSGRMTSVTL